MTTSQELRLDRAVRDGDHLTLGATAREIAAGADAVPTACDLLESDHVGRREFAVRLLGEIAARGGDDAPDAVAALAGLVRAGEEHTVLCGALEALAALADATAAREPLLALAGHPSFSIRWRLAAALRAAHGGDPRVDDALVALAGDPRPIVRLEAVDAMALLPPPRHGAVDDALRAACDDADDRTAVSALVGLARAGAPLPGEPLARVLAPERMCLVSSGAAERLLTALAASGRPEAHAPLRHLALLWKPREPIAARALGAALEATAAAGPVPQPAAR